MESSPKHVLEARVTAARFQEMMSMTGLPSEIMTGRSPLPRTMVLGSISMAEWRTAWDYWASLWRTVWP